MSLAKHEFTEAERIATRRTIVAEMYLKGRVQASIAKDVGVTQQQVSADLKAIRVQWLQSGLQDFNAIKSEQLAKLDTLESTYWDAWERSKQDKEKKITKRKSEPAKGDDKPVIVSDEAGIIREGQVGDPRFLEGVERCIEKRCKIFGLFAPEKVDLKIIEERESYEAGVERWLSYMRETQPEQEWTREHAFAALKTTEEFANVEVVLASKTVQ